MSYVGARFLLNRADMVATVSNTSKNLIETNKLTTKPVVVIYNAPDLQPNDSTSESPAPSRRRRLLYMGSFMPYKNVELLVSALRDLPEFELVLLSKISDKRRTELSDVAGQASSQIVFQNGVSDQRYANELKAGFALVSASKDEGFGIPLVEAMKFGLPIVVSEIPIFKEIAADSALYFDPNSSIQFAERIRSLEHQTTWSAMSKAATERGQLFDWNTSAVKLLEALKSL